MFDYTVKTPKSLEEAISSLEENLKSEGFGVLWNFDLTAKLQEKGAGLSYTVYSIRSVQSERSSASSIAKSLSRILSAL